MITNTGKGIIAKYLIGQAPAYASYIAIGCGAKPLLNKQALQAKDYSGQENLEFEMFRVPIISRGYVNEDGVSKVVLTAELPSEERYEISEIGVYSAGSNSAVGFYGSKVLQAFNNENWIHHTTSSTNAIPSIYEPLDGDLKDNSINDASGGPAYQKPVFRTNADNRIFNDTNRSTRYERCRFFNNLIAIAGDEAELTTNLAGHLIPETGSSHIHLTGTSFDLNKNAPDDELRLAFTVINKTAIGTVPDRVKVLLEFSSSDTFDTTGDGSQWARFEVNLENGTGPGQWDLENNRYVVAKKELQSLYKSSAFTWNAVNMIKVYASVEKDGLPSADHYVCLDALRLENKSTTNSLYGLTGYSVIVNPDAAQTIVKPANTTNFVEFRFAMGVQ